MTIQNKITLSRQQLDDLRVKSSIPAAKPPVPSRCLSLWRTCKEAMALVADGTAVWPILGMTGVFNGVEGWLHHFWMVQ